MLPSSSFPGSPSPRKAFLSVRRVVPIAVTVMLVAVVAIVLVAHSVANTPRQASGPAVTATASAPTSADSTPTPEAAGTTTPGPTPPPTSAAGNPGTQTTDVRITQNQDERQPCLNEPAPYKIVLFNAGGVAANWHVNIPEFVGMASGGPISLAQPHIRPHSSYPYWANVSPQNGSLAPGQSASFAVTIVWGMPCGSTLYKAAVQLSFPSGGSQADIPFTFGGTGPARYSDVVLVSGSLNITQPCPASGSAPAPFTFAIKNTGNYFAVPYVVVPETGPGLHYWTDTQYVADLQEPVSTWLYPGETWTFTISPVAGLSCGGASYTFELQVNNAQGTTTSMTFTDTFN